MPKAAPRCQVVAALSKCTGLRLHFLFRCPSEGQIAGLGRNCAQKSSETALPHLNSRPKTLNPKPEKFRGWNDLDDPLQEAKEASRLLETLQAHGNPGFTGEGLKGI